MSDGTSHFFYSEKHAGEVYEGEINVPRCRPCCQRGFSGFTPKMGEGKMCEGGERQRCCWKAKKKRNLEEVDSSSIVGIFASQRRAFASVPTANPSDPSSPFCYHGLTFQVATFHANPTPAGLYYRPHCLNYFGITASSGMQIPG